VSRSGEPVKLLRLVTAHMRFRVERTSATCVICHELKDRGDEPSCERCGLGAFHLDCYIAAIARGPRERRFWATRSAAVSGALAPFAPFLCPGCRS
jgi:hypothetical protein